MSTAIEVHDMTVAYHQRPVLWNVDVSLPTGSLVGIVGPNGAGKSTFLKAILGLVPLASGWVTVFGKPLAEVRLRVGYIPQRESVDWEFPVSVRDVVLMGRYGRLGWLRRPSATDRRVSMESLERLGIKDLAERQIGQLSGGQQQRVFLARALAQDADIYLMDEPFAGVDAATEATIVDVLRDLRSKGKSVLAVHHDLQSVADYFDHLVLINMRLVAAGPADKVFTQANLHKTYGGRLTLLVDAAEAVRAAAAGRSMKSGT